MLTDVDWRLIHRCDWPRPARACAPGLPSRRPSGAAMSDAAGAAARALEQALVREGEELGEEELTKSKSRGGALKRSGALWGAMGCSETLWGN